MRSLPYSPHVAELWVVHSSSSIEPFPFGRSQFDALPAHVCRLAASFLQPRAQQQLLVHSAFALSCAKGLSMSDFRPAIQLVHFLINVLP